MPQRVPARGYRISEIAQETGLVPSTIRYYERIGLIPEPDRTEGGHRLYSTDDVERLNVLAGAKSLGLALDDIGVFLSRWERGECPPAREVLEQLVERKLDDTRHRIAELVEFHRALEEAFADLSERPVPTRCGPGCGCDVAIDRREGHTAVRVGDPPGPVAGDRRVDR